MSDAKGGAPRPSACIHCHFWSGTKWDFLTRVSVDEAANRVGSCHRHAPAPALISTMLTDGERLGDMLEGTGFPRTAFEAERVRWPQTAGDDWCGEYRSDMPGR